ncbi:MAG: carbon-nitrogen hydrolase [Candidatus Omnitrophica bacterium]|nr:carbon-nitrogen hydrolase [Candidatus Omnitrophota bacterium]
MSKIKVALIQMSAVQDPASNHQKAIEKIRSAAKKGAQIVCLQELYRTLYFCQSEDHQFFQYAEPVDSGSTIDSLCQVAEEESVVVIAPVFEKRTEGIYHNSAVVIDADGRRLGHYRKMHIPDDPNFYEKFYFTPGDLGVKVFKTRYARISVLICWDQWFPETARLAALKGCQILFYPTAIGWHESDKKYAAYQRNAWQTIQRGHAIANEIFVAAANRVGKEQDLNFWGHSFISDPFGSLIAEAAHDREEELIAECDLSLIEQTRQHWPFLRDRRIDAYHPLTERFLDNDK